MHKIVMWLGGVTAGMGVIFFVLIALVGGGLAVSTGQSGGAALLSAVTIGGGLILSGAMLYCFGAIVEHLIAIRRNGERQLEIFAKLGKPRG